MGWDIRAGDNELHVRRQCALISSWCAPYYESEPPPGLSQQEICDWWEPRIGVTDIPAEAVKAADAAVPNTYEEAIAKEYVKPVPSFALATDNVPWTYGTVSADDFERAREFLRLAAAGNHYIYGSY